MHYEGTVIRVQKTRGQLVLIVNTAVGLRGIDIDREVWAEIMRDFKVQSEQELLGWRAMYDPEHGDLTLIGPGDDEDEHGDPVELDPDTNR